MRLLIGLAVTATTLSIVAVFLPAALTGGIIGMMLYEFGMTVVVAVLISLVVSFTLTPMLSASFSASAWCCAKRAQHRGAKWSWFSLASCA